MVGVAQEVKNRMRIIEVYFMAGFSLTVEKKVRLKNGFVNRACVTRTHLAENNPYLEETIGRTNNKLLYDSEVFGTLSATEVFVLYR